MTARTSAQLATDLTTYITSGYKSISDTDMRSVLTNLVDSLLNKSDTDSQSIASALTVAGTYVSVGSTPSSTGTLRSPFGGSWYVRTFEDDNNVAIVRVDSNGNTSVGATSSVIPKTGAEYTSVRGPSYVSFVTGTSSRWFVNASALYPATDNSYSLCDASLRSSVVYSATGTINTSDRREKQDIAPIDDALLDAWAELSPVVYRWVDAVQKKKNDGKEARYHHGWVAQIVLETLAAHHIDGTRYGLLCYDEWDEIRHHDDQDIEEAETNYERVRHSEDTEAKNAAKAAVDAAHAKRIIIPAGNRWGLRYDQCLVVEAAYQRRRYDRLEQRVARLEGKVK